MKEKRGPKNWRTHTKLFEAYENGGRAIAKTVVHHPEMRQQLWDIAKHIDGWPSWYLYRFKVLYCEENPGLCQRLTNARWLRSQRRREKACRLEKREQAARRLTAHDQADSTGDRQ